MVDEGGAGTRSKLIYQDLTEQIIGAAIEVHKAIGPGLLESVYQECMCHELSLRGLRFKREVVVPVVYKGVALDCGYRLDLIVEETVILPTSYLFKVVGQTGRIHHQLQRSRLARGGHCQKSI